MYKIDENGVLKSVETWKVIIPLHDNSGVVFPQEEIDKIVEEITLRFPGMTAVNCAGVWRDAKQVYKDSNLQLIIDALPSEHSNTAEFFAGLKDELCQRLKQEKIYITKEGAKEELISFDEFFKEIGVEYDAKVSAIEKMDLARKLNSQMDMVLRRLGYETVSLQRDRANKKIIWERRFCGLTLRSVFDDDFPADFQIVAADRIDHVEKAFGFKGIGVVGDYEFLSFALEKSSHRPFVRTNVSTLNCDQAQRFLSPSGDALSLERFIEVYTMSVVTNYMVLREEGFLVEEIKITVGSDGSLQVGLGRRGSQLMYCPASIDDKEVQFEIIRCVGEACDLFENGGLDPVAIIQAKARNQYIFKRAALRRFLPAPSIGS